MFNLEITATWHIFNNRCLGGLTLEKQICDDFGIVHKYYVALFPEESITETIIVISLT